MRGKREEKGRVRRMCLFRRLGGEQEEVGQVLETG